VYLFTIEMAKALSSESDSTEVEKCPRRHAGSKKNKEEKEDEDYAR